MLGVAAGAAYATIPDGNKVYTACMLKNIGTLRLIDTSLPASNLMSHCTVLETMVTWNQQGQAGAPWTCWAAGCGRAGGPDRSTGIYRPVGTGWPEG